MLVAVWLSDYLEFRKYSSDARTTIGTISPRNDGRSPLGDRKLVIRYRPAGSSKDYIRHFFVNEEVFSQLSARGSVRVHYMPDKPQDALLAPQVGHNKQLLMMGGILFGIGSLLYLARKFA